MTTDSLPEDGQLRIGSITLPAGKRVHAGWQPAAWVTREEVSDAGRVWAALSELQQETGLVPFLLGTLSGDPSRPWDQEEFCDPIDPADADQMDPADVLKEMWDGETHEVDVLGQGEDPEFAEYIAEAIAPFSREFPGLAPREDAPLSPQQLDQTLGSLGAARIGLVPATRPADVLPLIGWTPSDQSDALPVTAVARSWEDRFGARLLQVGFAEIRLLVHHPPRSLDAAQRVAAEHWAFADECDEIGRSHVAAIAATLLRQPAIWQFWWD
jgi:Domain of unknown function (DUF4253)